MGAVPQERPVPQSPAPTSALQLQLHAYPRIVVGGSAQPVRLKRGLALLALLADARAPLGRQHLAERLWPDADARTGRGRLRRLVHELGGLVGHSLVVADADTLALAPGCSVDLLDTGRAIEAVLRAASLAAAPLDRLLAPGSEAVLAGFEIDAEAFGEWLGARRREHLARLQRALEHAAALAIAGQDGPRCDTIATRLLQLDPCAEGGHAARLAARALAGDSAGHEGAYHEAARVLRTELGVRPSARLEAVYAQGAALLQPQQPPGAIRYVDTGRGEVAHASWGQGPQAIVMLWGMVSNLEVAIEEPRARALLDRLARQHRVVMLDRRGTGLSERLGVVPDATHAAEDILATLDHLGIARAWLFGSSVGGTLALDFALRHPERTAGLLLFGTNARGAWAPDWPWAIRPEAFERWLASLTDPAHYAESLRQFAPTLADDPAFQHWYARLLRNAATRRGTAASLHAFQAMDLRPHLHRLRTPTLVMQRRDDRTVPQQAARWLAQAIPGARLALLEGSDHFHWVGDSAAVAARIEAFLRQHHAAPDCEALAA
jgi:pimeloyl-ACP methyl ester carboxylesterase/DNA-binding SARP family transcriptional activator